MSNFFFCIFFMCPNNSLYRPLFFFSILCWFLFECHGHSDSLIIIIINNNIFCIALIFDCIFFIYTLECVSLDFQSSFYLIYSLFQIHYVQESNFAIIWFLMFRDCYFSSSFIFLALNFQFFFLFVVSLIFCASYFFSSIPFIVTLVQMLLLLLLLLVFADRIQWSVCKLSGH